MRPLLLLAAVLSLAAACGGEDGATDAATSSDSAVEVVGEELFNERVIGTHPGCVTCHSLEERVTLVGPSLAGLAARAAATVPGLTAAEYLRLSITDPDSFVAEGFVAGQMPGGWEESLSESQIESLVEFMLEL
ncbi:MAG: c-type cytochrome [Acidimicrobiia bacterium]|nr:c-type cytochrome [Acidimicrobiia bacterium]